MKTHPAIRLAPVVLVLAFALACVAQAAAAPAISGSFGVSGVGGNNKLVAGPDGNMWVTINAGGDDVARITPAGEVKEFELEGVEGATGIAVDPAGTIWVTDGNGVAKFSVGDPKGTSVATNLAGEGVAGAEAIVAGPDGNMWVAASELVFHFATSDPTKLTKIPVAELMPKDIDVAGSLVVVSDNTQLEEKKGLEKIEFGRIVTMTTAGVLNSLRIPGASQGLAGAPSGQIAFSSALAKPEQAGLITPPGPYQSFELTGDPFGVALGSDQAFWIVQFTTGVLERVTASGVRSSLPGLPKEKARQISAGPNNTLWVTVPDEGDNTKSTVVRVSGLEPPVPPAPLVVVPQTKIAKGPKKVVKTTGKRAKVKFRFTSTVTGSTFQCALATVRKVRKGKKAPQPKFKGCKSPKSYSLKPGKYRFSVRALNAGVVDPSAATKTFRVVHVRKR